MGERIDLSTKRLAKAIDRLHRAAELRRRSVRGTREYEQALAEEERLSDRVMELAKITVANLAEREDNGRDLYHDLTQGGMAREMTDEEARVLLLQLGRIKAD